MNSKINKILIAVVVLEAIVLIWLLIDRTQQKKEFQKTITELSEVNTEKQKVTQELNDMLQQYENLKTDNAEVNAKLEEEQEKIKKLIVELRTVKRNDRYKIAQLEKETVTLKNIMKHYIKQIDSLNTVNQQLVVENTKVKKQYNNVLQETQELEEVRDSLDSKVKKAAVLKTYGLQALPLNRWGRNTKRAGWVKKIKICFTLAANDIAYTGTRKVYLRIANPEGRILTNSQSSNFDYNGKSIAYSIVRDFAYKGEDTQICMFWDAEDQVIMRGKFNIDIFVDGKNIGKSSFVLK